MKRYLFALSIAAAGVGLAGAGSRVVTPMAPVALHELSAGGAVGRPLTPFDRRRVDARGGGGPPRRGEPPRVWIQPSSQVADWTPYFVYEVHEAFVAWDSVSLPIQFE